MVIGIMNRKGGAGKTTVCVNLAAIYAKKYVKKGEKVLIIDLDPQANATTYLSCYDSKKPSIDNVIRENMDIRDVIVETGVPDLYLAPSFISLDKADVFLNCESVGREYYLKKRISGILDEYKYIFLDCPPSRNNLTINALTASDYAVLPCEATEYGFDSIEAMSEFIPEICSSVNSGLTVAGIVFCKREKTTVQKMYEDAIRASVDFPIFKSTIRKTTVLERSLNAHIPLIEYDKKNPVTAEYLELAKELYEKIK